MEQVLTIRTPVFVTEMEEETTWYEWFAGNWVLCNEENICMMLGDTAIWISKNPAKSYTVLHESDQFRLFNFS